MNNRLVIVVRNHGETLFSLIFAIRDGLIDALKHVRYVHNSYCIGADIGNPKKVADLQMYVLARSERLGAGIFSTEEKDRVLHMFKLDRAEDIRVAYWLMPGAVAISKDGIYEMVSLAGMHMVLDADSGMVFSNFPRWEPERRDTPEEPRDLPFDPWHFNVSKVSDMMHFYTENGRYYKYEGGYLVLPRS